MKESTVPRINLAPKLKRDLSLWNPFDYLLLLYWVFYFPQAIRWYVETRGGGDNHPVQLRLGIQGLLLTVITPLIICSIAANLGLSVDWVGVVLGVVFSVLLGVWGVVLGVAFIFAFFRPDNWLIGLLAGPQGRLFPRITLLPLPGLTSTLQQWLQQDWETAINNLNQYFQYSRQFIPVLVAVNRVLSQFPEAEIIYRVSRLAENPSDWELLKYASAKLFSFPDSQIRLDTPARAAAAGFWYLHQRDTEKAEKAFAVVRSLAYGEEMYSLAQTLHRFSQAATPDSIASLKVAPIAAEPSLRPQTWQAISSLNLVITEMALVQRSYSQQTRSLALNRIIGKLIDIGNQGAANLPQAEKELILSIVLTWAEISTSIAGTVGTVTTTQPIPNPYIIGDPGKRFVGREDILRELQSMWSGDNLSSVVLYGHRRMGKTSILRNLEAYLPPNVSVIYINLQRLATVTSLAEVLLTMAEEIAQTLAIDAPEEEKICQHPEMYFNRYLDRLMRQILPKKAKTGLIIALDEFEIIEDLIEANTLPQNFLGYLRSLVQSSPRLAFVFAGLHTLEEMTADYFHPFFGSVYPIPVSFLSPESTRVILANPVGEDEDFPLDYTPSALDKIYQLTHGQPYLVQLIGFHLVRFYNKQVFELQRPQDIRFQVEDVEKAIDAEFFQRGNYYFTGVWKQAKQDAAGQQEILIVLSPHLQGLTRADLLSSTGLTATTLDRALKTLENHHVIECQDCRYRIAVELFRRWVSETMA
ncbi:ATP-binding protein [Microcystis aeruginosa CS-555/01A07]|uniref:AAA family ATPase n=1 Tax=Microcystis aeruginosa TaxID=1126 RepID=UPI00232F2722|nr:ATP-binding protein [Microcystis aeruginosa]MDB9428434.1 ATP-binding protein [Microcystis aeruginosa CS-555/01A07]